ncbi:hypothetical protein ACHQM5_004061 [Ranunculus cassubicifolius]
MASGADRSVAAATGNASLRRTKTLHDKERQELNFDGISDEILRNFVCSMVKKLAVRGVFAMDRAVLFSEISFSDLYGNGGQIHQSSDEERDERVYLLIRHAFEKYLFRRGVTGGSCGGYRIHQIGTLPSLYFYLSRA